jgi:hypothetical protein
MSDPVAAGDAQPTNETASAEQGAAPAKSNAPDSGESAPEEQSQAIGDFDEKEAIHVKGYRKGRGKGRKEERAEILQRFGVESLEALETQWKGYREQQQEKAQHKEEREAQALRELRNEKTHLSGELETLRTENAKLQALSRGALLGEVRGRLVQSGVIPDAIEDAVSTAAVCLQWAPDARDIQVMTEIDGEPEVARESLEEYLDRFATEKPWYFKPSERSGSRDPEQVPRPKNPGEGQGDFLDRFKKTTGRS